MKCVFAYLVVLGLLSSLCELCADEKVQFLPELPFERLVGEWEESGFYLKPDHEKSPKERWTGKFIEGRSKFVIQYTKQNYWEFTKTGENDSFLAVHYHKGRPRERLTGEWDSKNELLVWTGKSLAGGLYRIEIELKDGANPRSYVLNKDADGVTVFEWRGQSEQKAF